jgi:hypothetical protein
MTIDIGPALASALEGAGVLLFIWLVIWGYKDNSADVTHNYYHHYAETEDDL